LKSENKEGEKTAPVEKELKGKKAKKAK